MQRTLLACVIGVLVIVRVDDAMAQGGGLVEAADHYATRRYDEAEAILRTLSGPHALAYLAATLTRNGKWQEVRAMGDSYLAFDRYSLPGARADEVYLTVWGNYLISNRMWETARGFMDARIVENPQRGYAYFYRGQAHYHFDRQDLMIEDYEIFLFLEPNAPEAPTIEQLLAGIGRRTSCYPSYNCRRSNGRRYCSPNPSCSPFTCPTYQHWCYDADFDEYYCALRCSEGDELFSHSPFALDLLPYGTSGQAGSCGYADWYAAEQRPQCEEDCGRPCVKKQYCGDAPCEPWPNYCWKCAAGGGGEPPPPTLPPPNTCPGQSWYEPDQQQACDQACGHACTKKQYCGGEPCQPWPNYCWKCS